MCRLQSIVLLFGMLLFVTGSFAQKKQVGKATYYSKHAHGKRTSSGKEYHRDSFTCAHRTYPFGTLLKVRDLHTDKEVIVKVTDRGPFCKGRVIDLSYAAAKELQLINRGVSNVEITKIIKGNRIPYKNVDDMQLPQLEVRTPDGAGYCLLSEWAEKKHEQELKKITAHASDSKSVHNGVKKLKKDSVARWKVFDKLSAKSNVEPANDFRYVVKY